MIPYFSIKIVIIEHLSLWVASLVSCSEGRGWALGFIVVLVREVRKGEIFYYVINKIY